jgi:hypothetical protein
VRASDGVHFVAMLHPYFSIMSTPTVNDLGNAAAAAALADAAAATASSAAGTIDGDFHRTQMARAVEYLARAVGELARARDQAT